MTTVIVGGGGFIGAHLAARLCQMEPVRVVSRSFRVAGVPSDHPNLKKIKGDFLHRQLMREVLAGADTVFHLASTTIPQLADQDPAYDISSNVLGTVQLLQLCVEQKIQKIVFASSGGTVYGPALSVPISESHATDPISAYGVTKLTIEKYLKLFEVTHGLEYRIVRLANPFGPLQLPTTRQGVIATFLKRAILNEPIAIWGDGSVVRDYLYVDDVVDALVAIWKSQSKVRLFNVGSGTGRSLVEIVDAISTALGKSVEIVFELGRSFDVDKNILDCGLARRELGWEPVVGFEDGVSRAATWMQRFLA